MILKGIKMYIFVLISIQYTAESTTGETVVNSIIQLNAHWHCYDDK